MMKGGTDRKLQMVTTIIISLAAERFGTVKKWLYELLRECWKEYGCLGPIIQDSISGQSVITMVKEHPDDLQLDLVAF
ncbi:hypothetical protein AAFF_G00116700 [Aldrovandia affinis]|uniref:Uncharacterized protein n=1 Tax=Aldrovandia affinis TaxID=143900 RepID=A0AAD7T1K4_9TELE|nr:hypothetical protein AAFF_G00116700 [Aldrovandia affinis]